MAGLATVSKLAGETVGQEFLIFTLGNEEYGIDILKVQEIRGYDQVTRIANTPDFIKGVTNLRGVIVPIIDLRVKFAQQGVSYDETRWLSCLTSASGWWGLWSTASLTCCLSPPNRSARRRNSR